MVILQTDSYPIEQHRDLDALERRQGDWFADRTFPMRILGYSRRCDLTPAKASVQRALRPRLDLARSVTLLLDAIAAAARGEIADAPAAVFAALAADDRARLEQAFGQNPALRTALA